MARVVYALLAGINDYQGRVNSLNGCVDDIRGFQEFLEGRVDKDYRRILPLINGDATRENIINGFTGHLAGAGEDDVRDLLLFRARLVRNGRTAILAS